MDLARAADLLQTFGEPSRLRLAALLDGRELSVAELTASTELAQSRVSTHLARLKEAGVLRDRRVGAATLYSLNDGAMPPDVREVWTLVSTKIDDRQLAADRARCDAVLRARAGKNGWADTVAGEMERHWSPGRTWESLAKGLIPLLDLGDVLDVGCGDGAVAQMLAPQARSLTCVDRHDRMIDAARARLAGAANVRVERADAHDLPFPAASFDQVLLMHVLDQAARPAAVLAECARVLRAGGSLVVLTLDRHDHQDVTAAYGHIHPGFAPATLKKSLEKAGLGVVSSAVVSREHRRPHFQVVRAFARKGRKAP